MDEPPGHHVMRHPKAKMFGQYLGCERSSVRCGIDHRDILPDFGVVDAKRDGAQKAIEPMRMLFNFRRTDAEAARFYHRVHTRKEVQVTFLVSTHEVAGKNDCFARETINLPGAFQ